MACIAKYKFNTHFAGKITEWFIFTVDSPTIAFSDVCWDSSAVLWLSHSLIVEYPHNAVCGSASHGALSLRLSLTQRDAISKYTGTKVALSWANLCMTHDQSPPQTWGWPSNSSLFSRTLLLSDNLSHKWTSPVPSSQSYLNPRGRHSFNESWNTCNLAF